LSDFNRGSNLLGSAREPGKASEGGSVSGPPVARDGEDAYKASLDFARRR